MSHYLRLAVVACCLFAFGAVSHAAEMLDQANMPGTGSGGVNVSADFDSVQIFTVGLDGFLTRAQANIRRSDQTVEDITLAIWTVDGVNLDTKLTEKALDPANVDTDFSFVNFVLPAPPQVTVGQQLAIELSSPANNTNDERYQWLRSGDYDGGTAFSPFPNGTRFSWQDDFQFKTYVDDVPEPASATLLLAAGLTLTRRRR